MKDIENNVAVYSGEMKYPEANANRFSGEVYVLIGPGSFSAAAMFPDLVKEYGAGVLIGQSTGGLPNTHGNSIYYTLPNSGLELTISNALHLRSDNIDGDGGVRPDIELRFDGERSDLEQVLEVIRELSEKDIFDQE